MRSFSYPHLRDRLRPVVKLPRTRLGRFTLYVFALDLLLYLVHELGRLFKSNVGSSLGGWIAFLVILGSVLLFIVLIRWIRQTVMWRLRNRLIVTYVFMAVIPVLLLVAMAGIAGWIFAGQFATFIVTSDIQQELKSLQAHNATLAQTMAAQLQHGRASGLPSLPFGAGVPAGHETAAWYRGRLVLNQTHGTLPNLPPAFVGKWFSDVVRDHGQLYLRAVTVIPVASDKLTVASSEALGESLLNEVAADLGQIVLYGGGVNIDAPATGNKGEHPAGPGRTTPSGVVGPVGFGTPTTVGKLPPPSFRFDREVSFFAPIYYVDWQTGDRESASLMTVQTRVSRLYDQLFSTFGKRSGWAAIILGGIATVLLLIELVALVIGVRLTRTITRSVAELYAATQHVNRGDFGHQISVESQDQLAALETSFN